MSDYKPSDELKNESKSKPKPKKTMSVAGIIIAITVLPIILLINCENEDLYQEAFEDCNITEKLPVCTDLTTIPNDDLYQEAVEDCIITENLPVCTNLTTFSDNDNSNLVSVVTWTNKNFNVKEFTNENDKRNALKKLDPLNVLQLDEISRLRNLSNYYITKQYIWVTKVPELKKWINGQRQSMVDELRIEQLLGLPPDSNKTKFVVMETFAENIFRPAYNPDITSNKTHRYFQNSTLNNPKYTEFLVWFKKNDKQKYPWTKLGYTYDWGNSESKIGLSEFVIKKGAEVYNVNSYTNEQYFVLNR